MKLNEIKRISTTFPFIFILETYAPVDHIKRITFHEILSLPLDFPFDLNKFEVYHRETDSTEFINVRFDISLDNIIDVIKNEKVLSGSTKLGFDAWSGGKDPLTTTNGVYSAIRFSELVFKQQIWNELYKKYMNDKENPLELCSAYVDNLHKDALSIALLDYFRGGYEAK